MKESAKELTDKEWADILEKGFQEAIKIAREGVNFSSKFMKNPIGFCESNNIKVYTGYHADVRRGRTYVVVNKMNNEKYGIGIIWLFLDRGMPSCLIREESVLNNLIEKNYFYPLGKETFMLWLNDSLEELKAVYEYNKRHGYYLKKDDSENEGIDVGKRIKRIRKKIAREGVNFSSKFMKNPIGFCESNNIKVYTGYYADVRRGRTYVVVNKMNNEKIGVIWLFFDGKMPACVISEDRLIDLIRFNLFYDLDKETFMLWLNDNVESLKEAYQCNKSVEKFKNIQKIKQKNGI